MVVLATFTSPVSSPFAWSTLWRRARLSGEIMITGRGVGVAGLGVGGVPTAVSLTSQPPGGTTPPMTIEGSCSQTQLCVFRRCWNPQEL